MARVVAEMPPGATRAKYPWHEWFDGGVWELTRGEDFSCSARIMGLQARSAAKRHRVQVRVAVRGQLVYVQALGRVT